MFCVWTRWNCFVRLCATPVYALPFSKMSGYARDSIDSERCEGVMVWWFIKLTLNTRVY